MDLKWERKDKYAQVSTDGRYSVCAIGGAGGMKFEGWRTQFHQNKRLQLAVRLLDAAEARKQCEADAND